MIDPHPANTDDSVQRKAIADTIKLFGNVASVLDVGCNVGMWARGFLDAGVSDCLGIDLYHLAPYLLIPLAHFRPVDLTRPLHLARQFDLVLCLEVGEHLPHQASSILADSLCEHGNRIAFSAAIPGQGGHGHINERPFSYWLRRFEARGYSCDLTIRKHLPTELSWWYRQNMAIFTAQ